MENLAERHIRIYDSEKSARSPLESIWQTNTYYCMPRRAYITKIKSIGDKLPIDIYDSTAIVCNAHFGAGMQAYMSSPQTKWFTLAIKNRNFMNNRNVLNYLRDTEDVLYSMINGSNFYQEDVEGYWGLGCIGTDILYAEEDLKEDVRFDSLPIESVIILNDASGRVNMAYIEYEYNSEQAYGKFGKAAGSKVIDCYEKSDYNTKFKYLFCVFPRDVYDQGKKDNKNMPFAALWISREEKKIIKEGGYKEFPFMTSRFAKAKNSPYGYSVADNIIADIQMLNQIEKSNIIAAQIGNRPPLEVPDEAFLRPFNFNPGGINIKNAGYPNEHITPIVTGANVKIGLDYIKFKQDRVAQGFYNDLFILMERVGDMTATEVNMRNNQRMQLLGSAIGNIMREKLSPVIDRVYAIAARNDKLPPLPPELIDEEYIVQYISPLARAQKSLELGNLQQALGIIAQFAQVNPDVLDKVDFDEATDYVAEITNIAPKIIRDDQEVDDIREGRAQDQQVAQQMAAMQQGTEITKVATEADKNIAESQTAGVK